MDPRLWPNVHVRLDRPRRRFAFLNLDGAVLGTVDYGQRPVFSPDFPEHLRPAAEALAQTLKETP